MAKPKKQTPVKKKKASKKMRPIKGKNKPVKYIGEDHYWNWENKFDPY